MALSKSALRKMRRYDRERYFRYLDSLLEGQDGHAFRAEVKRNVASPRAISIYEYIRDRRGRAGLSAEAQAALDVWGKYVRSLIPFLAERCRRNARLSKARVFT